MQPRQRFGGKVRRCHRAYYNRVEFYIGAEQNTPYYVTPLRPSSESWPPVVRFEPLDWYDSFKWQLEAMDSGVIGELAIAMGIVWPTGDWGL